MTRTNDIIAMARRAGAHDDGNEVRFVELRYLERFAALVAAAERERFYGQDKPTECAKGCPPKQICDYCQVVAPVRAMILAEREACAKVCEDKNTLLAWPTYAAAIRARGANHG